MHDITFIRENPDLFDELLKKRFIDPKSNEIISLDIKKRDILTKSQELRAERKSLSSSFANLNDSDKADLQKKVQLIKNKIDELENDITKVTPASFEPVIDYIVTKIPKFNFEKFQGTPSELNTAMKSVGEIMSIGRTFKESLLKAFYSIESDNFGLDISCLLYTSPSPRDDL